MRNAANLQKAVFSTAVVKAVEHYIAKEAFAP